MSSEREAGAAVTVSLPAGWAGRLGRRGKKERNEKTRESRPGEDLRQRLRLLHVGLIMRRPVRGGEQLFLPPNRMFRRTL